MMDGWAWQDGWVGVGWAWQDGWVGVVGWMGGCLGLGHDRSWQTCYSDELMFLTFHSGCRRLFRILSRRRQSNFYTTLTS